MFHLLSCSLSVWLCGRLLRGCFIFYPALCLCGFVAPCCEDVSSSILLFVFVWLCGRLLRRCFIFYPAFCLCVVLWLPGARMFHLLSCLLSLCGFVAACCEDASSSILLFVFVWFCGCLVRGCFIFYPAFCLCVALWLPAVKMFHLLSCSLSFWLPAAGFLFMFYPVRCLCLTLWLPAAGLFHVLYYLLSLTDLVTYLLQDFCMFYLVRRLCDLINKEHTHKKRKRDNSIFICSIVVGDATSTNLNRFKRYSTFKVTRMDSMIPKQIKQVYTHF